jgi:hypothetical protein
MLWSKNVNLNIIGYNNNMIDCYIVCDNDSNNWRATGIYGFPNQNNKHLTCDLISRLSQTNDNDQWLLFGDFNLVLASQEKAGGNLPEPNVTTSFRNTIDHCDLQDLGYNGNLYTWTNRQEGS